MAMLRAARCAMRSSSARSSPAAFRSQVPVPYLANPRRSTCSTKATQEPVQRKPTAHSGPFVEFDVSEKGRHYDDAYRLLTALVVPRPIALVTTLGSDGTVNAAPYSFFNAMGTDPPIVTFAPSDKSDGTPKDTALNIMNGHNFVVNLVDEDIAQAMTMCAASLPYGVSELAFAGLTTVPSSVVASPRILQAPASLECTEWDTLKIGNNRLVVGVVQRIHVRADLVQDVTKCRIDRAAYKLVGRMQSPSWYSRTRDMFSMQVPSVEEIEGIRNQGKGPVG